MSIIYITFNVSINGEKECQTALLKCYYDENHIISIEAILRHKQVACMRRQMLFTIFKYLSLVQRYSSF